VCRNTPSTKHTVAFAGRAAAETYLLCCYSGGSEGRGEACHPSRLPALVVGIRKEGTVQHSAVPRPGIHRPDGNRSPKDRSKRKPNIVPGRAPCPSHACTRFALAPPHLLDPRPRGSLTLSLSLDSSLKLASQREQDAHFPFPGPDHRRRRVPPPGRWAHDVARGCARSLGPRRATDGQWRKRGSGEGHNKPDEAGGAAAQHLRRRPCPRDPDVRALRRYAC